jgi:hypothetical protein
MGPACQVCLAPTVMRATAQPRFSPSFVPGGKVIGRRFPSPRTEDFRTLLNTIEAICLRDLISKLRGGVHRSIAELEAATKDISYPSGSGRLAD